MVFASSGWLWALLALPLMAAVAMVLTRHDADRVARLVARALWPRVVRQNADYWRVVRLGLVLLGAAGIVLALAQPQWGMVREKIEREGVDIVLAIDSSGSMATEDVAPNRLFLARSAVSSLVARLEGDRFALLAFEGEAYPLVPLTLDADAVGLFLETIEPGTVPAPGTSLGQGLVRGLDLFVDKERRNKVMVLVSDGEDLEGDVEAAVTRARQMGVVVHTVGVGTVQGQPVPNYDREGRRQGFKKAEDGSVVVSRLNTATLEAVARGTGGRTFLVTPQDASLSGLAAAIEGMEQKGLAREFAYRRKERFQIPLAVGLASLTFAVVLPLRRMSWPGRRARRAAGTAAVALVAMGILPGRVFAETQGSVVDEVLLRAPRITAAGRKAYAQGNHPEALAKFEQAARLRPQEALTRFNLADGLYKQGKYDQAEVIYRDLASDGRAELAQSAAFNLGNTLYQKHDYAGAVQAYRQVLRAKVADEQAQRNLELALRALQQQKKQQDQKQQQQPGSQQRPQPAPQTPKNQEEREQERFRQETGMPKERAMQLLDALQRNERDEQRKALAARRVERKGAKDW
jgi:Ca-activated chloride channel family protein